MTEEPVTDGSSTASSDRPDATARTVRFDWSEPGQPIVAIVTALAEATERDPLDIESLHEHVDGDALNTLVAPSTSSDTRSRLHVSFLYDGYAIFVTGDGEVTVESRKREAATDDR